MRGTESPRESSDASGNWTRSAPKFAAATVLLALASAGLALSLGRWSPGPGISATEGVTADVSVRIDLNRATAAELESLPAIGPRRAEAIIADREERGPFRSIEDLDRVPGIGAGTIARIRAYLVVAPPVPPAAEAGT